MKWVKWVKWGQWVKIGERNEVGEMGAIGEMGYVAKHDQVKDILMRQGVGEIMPESVWKALRCGIIEDHDLLGIMSVDWDMFSNYSSTIRRSPRFEMVRLRGNGSAGADKDEHMQAGIDIPQDPEKRKEYLVEILKRCVTNVLGISMEGMDLSKRIGTPKNIRPWEYIYIYIYNTHAYMYTYICIYIYIYIYICTCISSLRRSSR